MQLNSINNTSFGMACTISKAMDNAINKLKQNPANLKRVQKIETAYRALDNSAYNFTMDISKNNPGNIIVTHIIDKTKIPVGEFSYFSPKRIARKAFKVVADEEIATATEQTIRHAIHSSASVLKKTN